MYVRIHCFVFCNNAFLFVSGTCKSFADEKEIEIVRWRNFDQKDRAYLTVTHGFGSDAYTGPSMDCEAGRRTVRMWMIASEAQKRYAADKIVKLEPIGIFIVSKYFEMLCPKERL